MLYKSGIFAAGNHARVHRVHEHINIGKDHLGCIGNDDCSEYRFVDRKQVVTHWLPKTRAT